MTGSNDALASEDPDTQDGSQHATSVLERLMSTEGSLCSEWKSRNACRWLMVHAI